MSGMDELYSRPLSHEARAALVAFIEADVLSLRSQKADAAAEHAKQLAAATLATDIDILVFTIAVRTIYISHELLRSAVIGRTTPQDFAAAVVRITEEARSVDIQQRPS